jgi:RHS repeat-associated protein
VSYTHAGGVDRPLLITKNGTSVVPHQNWRGMFAQGTNPAGQLPVPDIDWPGYHTTPWHGATRVVENWFGSLSTGMRDASGQMYMRNRYYDPASGQFTQPDPIGLAGGLNSYGFAAGDPVSYSDPYGLCKVDVNFNRIGPGYHHAYIVTTAPDATRMEYRAGPSGDGPSGSGMTPSSSGGASARSSGSNSDSSDDSGNSSSPGSGNGHGDDNTGPWGAIEPTVEPYDQAAIDWNPTPEGRMRVVDDDKPCDRYHAAFTFALGILANARIPYNPLSTNSNATVGFMLETAQIKYGKPPVWAPGWNTELF